MVYLNSEVIALGYLFLSFLYFNFNVIVFSDLSTLKLLYRLLVFYHVKEKFFERNKVYGVFEQ